MTKFELNEAYFDWMCQLVCSAETNPYQRLLRHLHNIEFTYILEMDGNRAADGEDLRYRFGYEMNYDRRMIASYLDDRPCSVLEMMVALAFRCEEDIMANPDKGDRTGVWFWTMIESLGLSEMTDYQFDAIFVDSVIKCFLERKYQQNGKGGLFTVNRRGRDLRNVEIWYQMNWYLDTI